MLAVESVANTCTCSCLFQLKYMCIYIFKKNKYMNYHRLWVSYMMSAMILMMTPQSYRVSHRGGASGILPLQRKSSPPPQIISSMKPKIYILLLWKDKHILHVHVQNSTLHDYTCIYLHCTCTTCTLYTYTCIYILQQCSKQFLKVSSRNIWAKKIFDHQSCEFYLDKASQHTTPIYGFYEIQK